MPKEHKVKQGECLSSIADKYGLFPGAVWDDPANAALKEKRKDPNVLYPGDVVVIPDKRDKKESGVTQQRHRFRKKGVPAKLRLQMMDGGEPLANEPYKLEIDGALFSGTTDDEGRIEHEIPPKAKKCRLLLGEKEEEYLLNLGHLDPVSEIAGIQQRLNNLGFDCGKVDGILGPKTNAALKNFQKEYSLKESGEIDESTRNRLATEHGS